MLISWLNKLSLIDYPWHIACVVFTLGCNLRCRYCHNPDFVLPERIRTLRISKEYEKEFFYFLEKRRWLLEGVSICWGEPTLQHDLVEFATKIKNLWYKVKLDTNGRYPEKIRDLLEKKLLDYIAMDIKHIWTKYPLLTGIEEDMRPYQESLAIIKNSSIEYEFRTTLIEGIHEESDMESLGKIITGSRKYFLQQYRPGDTLESNFPGKKPSREMMEQWGIYFSTHHDVETSLRF